MEYEIQPTPTRVGDRLHSDVPGYREGTWIPSLGGDTTYISQRGLYTRVGRLVFIQLAFEVNVIGTGSTVNVTGLPFTSSGDHAAISIADFDSLASSVVYLTGWITPEDTDITFQALTAASATLGSANPIFGNGTILRASGIYTTLEL